MTGSGNIANAKLGFTAFSNVIDGKLCNSSTGKTRCSVNPATLEDNPQVPVSTRDDVDRAVQSAQKAKKAWASVPWAERQKALKGLIDAFDANVEEFQDMLVREQGKSIGDAKIEIWQSQVFSRGLSDLSLPEEVLENSDKRKVISRFTPLGVAVGMVPWNYPLGLSFIKIASCLVTGNTLILKPSPHAPYCILKLAELGLRFFPPGVFQALSGDDDLGPWLTAHPGVDVVSFTGSIEIGKKVMELCSKTLKRCILELGGNDPAIVCSDVDIKAVAPALAYLALANSGQICFTPKRIFVHESIYDKFVAGMAAYANAVSFKADDNPAIGPVSNKPQYERVKQMLADIELNNLSLVAGSTKPPTDQKGFYLAPTIVDNPPDDSRIVAEEPFGPVFPVLKWSEESEVIERANKTEYGLSASVWSGNVERAERIARQIEAGTVWINTHGEPDPKFGAGSYKNSGIGIHYGVDGLKEYCNKQVLYTKFH